MSLTTRDQLLAQYVELCNAEDSLPEHIKAIDTDLAAFHPDRSTAEIWPFPNDGILGETSNDVVLWNRERHGTAAGENLHLLPKKVAKRFVFTSSPTLPFAIAPGDLTMAVRPVTHAKALVDSLEACADLALIGRPALSDDELAGARRTSLKPRLTQGRVSWVQLLSTEGPSIRFVTLTRGECFAQLFDRDSPIHVVEALAGRIATVGVDGPLLDDLIDALIALRPTHVIIYSNEPDLRKALLPELKRLPKRGIPSALAVSTSETAIADAAFVAATGRTREWIGSANGRTVIPQFSPFERALGAADLQLGDVIAFAREPTLTGQIENAEIVELIAALDKCHFTHAAIVAEISRTSGGDQRVALVHRSGDVEKTSLAAYGAKISARSTMFRSPALVLRHPVATAGTVAADKGLLMSARTQDSYPLGDQALAGIVKYAHRGGANHGQVHDLAHALANPSDAGTTENLMCAGVIAAAYAQSDYPLTSPYLGSNDAIDIRDMFGQFWLRFAIPRLDVPGPEENSALPQSSAESVRSMLAEIDDGTGTIWTLPPALDPASLFQWAGSSVRSVKNAMGHLDFFEAISASNPSEWNGPNPVCATSDLPPRMWGVGDLFNSGSLGPVGHLPNWWTIN